MEEKNIALLGFVSQAADYLKDQIKDDGDEIKTLDEVDLDKIKSELENKLGSSFSSAKDKSDDLINAGREVFDNFISKSPTLIDEFKDIFDVDFKKENDEKDKMIVNHLISILKKPIVNDETDELLNQIAKAASDNCVENKPKEENEFNDNKELDSIFFEILANEGSNTNDLKLEDEPAKEEIPTIEETDDVFVDTVQEPKVEEQKFDADEIKQLIKDTISEFFVDKKQEAEVKLDEVIDSFDELKSVTEDVDVEKTETEEKEDNNDLNEEFEFIEISDSNELEEVEFEELNPNNDSLLGGIFKRVDEPEEIEEPIIEETQAVEDDVFTEEVEELSQEDSELQSAALKLEDEVLDMVESDDSITVDDIIKSADDFKPYDHVDINDLLKEAESTYIENYEASNKEPEPIKEEILEEPKQEEIILNDFNIEKEIEEQFNKIQLEKAQNKDDALKQEDDFSLVDGVLIKGKFENKVNIPTYRDSFEELKVNFDSVQEYEIPIVKEEKIQTEEPIEQEIIEENLDEFVDNDIETTNELNLDLETTEDETINVTNDLNPNDEAIVEETSDEAKGLLNIEEQTNEENLDELGCNDIESTDDLNLDLETLEDETLEKEESIDEELAVEESIEDEPINVTNDLNPNDETIVEETSDEAKDLLNIEEQTIEENLDELVCNDIESTDDLNLDLETSEETLENEESINEELVESFDVEQKPNETLDDVEIDLSDLGPLDIEELEESFEELEEENDHNDLVNEVEELSDSTTIDENLSLEVKDELINEDNVSETGLLEEETVEDIQNIAEEIGESEDEVADFANEPIVEENTDSLSFIEDTDTENVGESTFEENAEFEQEEPIEADCLQETLSTDKVLEENDDSFEEIADLDTLDQIFEELSNSEESSESTIDELITDLNDKENHDDSNVPLSSKLSSVVSRYKGNDVSFSNDVGVLDKDDYDFELNRDENSDSISSFLKELKENSEVEKEDTNVLIADLIDQCQTLCPDVEEANDTNPEVIEEEPTLIDEDYIEAYNNRTLDEIYIPNPGLDALWQGEPIDNEDDNKSIETDKEASPVEETLDDSSLDVTTEETIQEDSNYLNDLFDDFTSNGYEVDTAFDKQKQEEAKKKEIYDSIVALYPYLSNGFIKGVYDLKQSFAIDYSQGEKIVILHRLHFEDVNGLRQFVDVMINHDYLVNVDEKQMIVDVFKEHINSDGKILTDIFEIANQAKLLTGDYEGYRIIEDEN